MKKLASFLAIPAVAAAFCAPLSAQEAQSAAPEKAPAVVAESAEADPLPDAMAGMQAAASAAEVTVVTPNTAETPKAKAKAAAVPAGSVPELELNFIKAAAADKDDDVQAMALAQAEDWLKVYPALPRSGEALQLEAGLHYKLGDYKSALVALLRHFREYPGDASAFAAKKLFTEILDKKADKKLRPALTVMAGEAQGSSKEEGLADLLQKLSAQAGDVFYDALVAEYRGFFLRFPAYSRDEALRLALADLHAKKEEYLAARVAYDKVIAMYPAGQLAPKAKLALAGTLTENLKDHDRAIQVYLDIVDSYPGTPEAWSAYLRLPALAEKRDKYQLAVETYERIILLYPDKEEAFKAFQAEARVLREELKKPAEAIAVLNRLADKYKDARGIDALLLAAEIYRKDLKDAAGEIKTYDRIAADYASDPQAPKALLAAGEVYEKTKDLEKARKYYEDVTQKYAEDASAKKAQKRLDGLLAR
ncbi:MAG: tetratricopeptide repeat protein [Elusimicrobia bacterium]|nr:tetratricopeptide repeat protein [Elusimicrobiota bacterium]